jgi:2'-5' RNA ligase
MKATFALLVLADVEIHNLVRKLSWDIHRAYRTDIDVCRLQPHISLKQPFVIADVKPVEEYMAELAVSLTPFEVDLTALELFEATIDGMETGILMLGVHETETLRGLHNRVHVELTARLGDVSAAFDGPEYHFHMTVAIGGQPVEVYRKIKAEYSDRLRDLRYTVREMVMFVYDEREEFNAGYMEYKILPLGDST